MSLPAQLEPHREPLQTVWSASLANNGVVDPTQPCDVLFVPGSFSLAQARVAADAYVTKVAAAAPGERLPIAVFTGWKSKATSEWGTSEAAASEKEFRKVLLKHGIREVDVEVRHQADNVGAALKDLRAVLTKRGMLGARVLGIVKPYISERFKATCERQFPDVADKVVWGVPTTDMDEWHELVKRFGTVNPSMDAAAMAGDFARLIDPDSPHLKPRKATAEQLQALQYLIERGIYRPERPLEEWVARNTEPAVAPGNLETPPPLQAFGGAPSVVRAGRILSTVTPSCVQRGAPT